jgi:hypothetical protein
MDEPLSLLLYPASLLALCCDLSRPGHTWASHSTGFESQLSTVQLASYSCWFPTPKAGQAVDSVPLIASGRASNPMPIAAPKPSLRCCSAPDTAEGHKEASVTLLCPGGSCLGLVSSDPAPGPQGGARQPPGQPRPRFPSLPQGKRARAGSSEKQPQPLGRDPCWVCRTRPASILAPSLR